MLFKLVCSFYYRSTNGSKQIMEKVRWLFGIHPEKHLWQDQLLENSRFSISERFKENISSG